MQIIIKKAEGMGADFEAFIEKKFATLDKLIESFDKTGDVSVRLEVSRATRHHKQGNVFKIAADINLPHKILHAEDHADDIRAGVDAVKNLLRLEIEKYKSKISKTAPRANKEG